MFRRDRQNFCGAPRRMPGSAFDTNVVADGSSVCFKDLSSELCPPTLPTMNVVPPTPVLSPRYWSTSPRHFPICDRSSPPIPLSPRCCVNGSSRWARTISPASHPRPPPAPRTHQTRIVRGPRKPRACPRHQPRTTAASRRTPRSPSRHLLRRWRWERHRQRQQRLQLQGPQHHPCPTPPQQPRRHRYRPTTVPHLVPALMLG